MVYSFNYSLEGETDVIVVSEVKDGYAYFSDGKRTGRMEEKLIKKNFTEVETPKLD